MVRLEVRGGHDCATKHVVWKIGSWSLFSRARRFFSFDFTKHVFAFYFQQRLISIILRLVQAVTFFWPDFILNVLSCLKKSGCEGKACSELLKSTH